MPGYPSSYSRLVPLRTLVWPAVVGALVVHVACGGSQPDRTSPPATPAATAAAGSPATPAAGDVTSYFHDQLVVNGEEVQSDFGSALLTLGLNPRDLQQDTPDHAYHTVLEKVQAVKDDGERRAMMRTLFGTDTPR